MTRALPLLLLAAGCYEYHQDLGDRPATFADLELGEQVPTALLIEAADALEPCMGRPYALDGWTAWVVADSLRCFSGDCFLCPMNVMPICGPVPAGYTEQSATCACSGVTDFDSQRIAVAPDLKALSHEVIHAGWTVYGHDGAEWECQ